jgi:carboxypeptidase Taq
MSKASASRSSSGGSAPQKVARARRRTDTQIAELKLRLREISDLSGARSVLGWDQATYMPPGAADLRGRQMALLGRLVHDRLTDPAIGRLLDAIEADTARIGDDELLRDLVTVTRRDWERARRVPAEFVVRSAEHGSRSYAAWVSARPANDFAATIPFLEETVRLRRELSQLLGGGAELIDPLVERSEPGLSAQETRALFKSLRPPLVDLVKKVSERPRAESAPLRQHFPAEPQLAFALAMAERFGYDLRRGRQDRSPHPFCTTFGIDDVRITTRVREDDFSETLYSTLHETGHALYEQGCDPELEGTPLAGGASAGVHESQSRLWENIVGRSRGFAVFAMPLLKRAFPRQFGRTTPEAFYKAVNIVERSLIRTDADELTYNLHVMIRFDLECDLLEGRLAVAELPDAWHARYSQDLGVAPPDHSSGCLQDVHWYGGYLGGAFQSYTIGNILSAQFYSAAVAAHPEIPARIERGEFAPLHRWLEANVYRHGRRFMPRDLVHRATGRAMSSEPYLAYLREKYDSQ